MTPLQLAVLDFVVERLTNIGCAPKLDEIADHVRGSKTQAHGAVNALVQMGKLKKTTGRWRNIGLVDRPDLRAVGSDVLHAELARRGDTLEALSHGQRLAFGRVRTCAVDTCGQAVDPGHLMCRGHWWALTPAMQAAIKDAHAAQDLPTYRRLVAEARDYAADRSIG